MAQFFKGPVLLTFDPLYVLYKSQKFNDSKLIQVIQLILFYVVGDEFRTSLMFERR